MTPLKTIRMSFKDHVYPEKRDPVLCFAARAARVHSTLKKAGM